MTSPLGADQPGAQQPGAGQPGEMPLPDGQDWREQAEQAKKMMSDFRESAQQRGAAAEQATAQMQAIEVEAWSPQREVRVVLGSTALITDLEYAPGVSTGSPQSLARAVQAAHDAALRMWNERVEQITESTLADDPALGEHIRQAARQQLPGRVLLDED